MPSNSASALQEKSKRKHASRSKGKEPMKEMVAESEAENEEIILPPWGTDIRLEPKKSSLGWETIKMFGMSPSPREREDPRRRSTASGGSSSGLPAQAWVRSRKSNHSSTSRPLATPTAPKSVNPSSTTTQAWVRAKKSKPSRGPRPLTTWAILEEQSKGEHAENTKAVELDERSMKELLPNNETLRNIDSNDRHESHLDDFGELRKSKTSNSRS